MSETPAGPAPRRASRSTAAKKAPARAAKKAVRKPAVQTVAASSAARAGEPGGEVRDAGPGNTVVRELDAEAAGDRGGGAQSGQVSAHRRRGLGDATPFRAGFAIVLGGAVAAVLCYSVYLTRGVLLAIALSLLIAIGLEPVVAMLGRRGLGRGRAVACVLALVVGAIAAFSALVVPPLADEVGQLAKNLPSIAAELSSNERVEEISKRFPVVGDALEQVEEDPEQVQNLGGKLAGGLAGNALGAGKAAIGGLFTALTILVLTLYFVITLPQMKGVAVKLTPASSRPRMQQLMDQWLLKVGGYCGGVFLTALIAAVAAGIFLSIVGVPYAAALAVVVFLTSLVPLIGNIIGAAVCLLVALFVSPKVFLIALVYFVIYNQAENYVLSPRIMKRSVNLPPAATMISVLAGGAILGVAGAVLAIPLAAGVQLLLEDVVFPRQLES